MSAPVPARRPRSEAAPALAPPIPEPAAAPAELAGSLLNFVARAMSDPSVNVDKLEVLLRMQREIVANDARLQFHRAMGATQGAMQAVVRDAQNTQTNSKYARLETIDAAIRPIYTSRGFNLSFDTVPIDPGTVRVVCEVAHESGHSKTYHLEAAPDSGGIRGNTNKTPLHALGSAITYLRRYLTCMIFNVVLANEDADGNRARVTQEDGEVPGRDQVAELYALLADCSANPAARESNERTFLVKMGLGRLRSIKDTPAADFPRLKNALVTKKALLARNAAASTAITLGRAAP